MTENEKNLTILCLTCYRKHLNVECITGTDFEKIYIPPNGVCDIHKCLHMKCPDYIEEAQDGVLPCRMCKYWGKPDDDKKMKTRHCSIHDIPTLATRESCRDFDPHFAEEILQCLK